MALWERLSKNSNIRLAQVIKRRTAKQRKDVSVVTGVGYSTPAEESTGSATTHISLLDINTGDRLLGGHTYATQRHEAAADPTATDDTPNYNVGDIWTNTTTDKSYICSDNTTTAAIWTDITIGASVLTTKGDVWGYDTIDKRIPIGTNDQVLTADSTQALGLKWADANKDTQRQSAHLLVIHEKGETWQTCKPASAVAAAPVGHIAQLLFDATNFDCDNVHGQWRWESTAHHETLQDGADVVVPMVFNLTGNMASIYARIYVNNTDRLDNWWFGHNGVDEDNAGNGQRGKTDVLGQCTSGKWRNVKVENIDTSSASSNVSDGFRVWLFAIGTTNDKQVGDTIIRIEDIVIKQWTA